MKIFSKRVVFAILICGNLLLPANFAYAESGNFKVDVREYVTVAGDNFPMLAARIGEDAELLAAMNNMSKSAAIPANTKIFLPVESDKNVVATLASRGDFSIREMYITHWYSPAKGVITSPFSVNRNGKPHHGVDIGIPSGTPIQAGQSGVIMQAGWCNSVYGYAVRIDHGNGWQTFYAHCSKVLCKKGETVVAGELIALSGNTGNSTGPHLHLEMKKDGTFLNPLDFFLNITDKN